MIFNFNSDVTYSFKQDDFNVLDTKSDVASSNLKTIYGNGYIILCKVSGSSGQALSVYIDGNTKPFTLTLVGGSGNSNNYVRFYFQESIRFEPYSSHSFYYQTLLADKELPKRYDIIQGSNESGNGISFEGKGKVILANGSLGLYYPIEVDGKLVSIPTNANQYIDIFFTKSFKCITSTAFYYIVYLEK